MSTVTRIQSIQTGSNGSKALGSNRKPTEVITLLLWQLNRYQRLRDEMYRLISAPTGSGKTVLLQALALYDCNLGYKIILSYPRRDIAAGFSQTLRIKLPGCKAAQVWSPRALGEDVVGEVEKFLLTPRSEVPGFQIIICTHAALVAAHKRLGSKGSRHWRGVSLFVDEVHRSQYDEERQETNGLGLVIDQLLSDPSNRVSVATATFFRTEGQVISARHLERFASVPYHIDEYLSSLKFLKKINIHLVVGPMIGAFKQLIKQDPHRKTVVFQPNNLKRVQTDALNGTLLRALKPLNLDVCNLVRQETQQASVVHLTEVQIRKEKEITGRLTDREVQQIVAKQEEAPSCTPDLILALNMCQEGFNWPAASRAILLAPRGSLVACLQILGRMLRDWPGKEAVDLYVIVEGDENGEIEADNAAQYINVLFTYMAIGWQYNRAIRSVSKKTSKAQQAAEHVLCDAHVMAEILERTAKYAIVHDEEDPAAWDHGFQKIMDELVDSHPDLEDQGVRDVVRKTFDEFMKSTGKSMAEDANIPMLADVREQVGSGDRMAILRCYMGTVGHRDLAALRRVLTNTMPTLSFEEARKVARARGFESGTAYKEAFQLGHLPPGLPASPHAAYCKHPEWKGMPEFLGYGSGLPRSPILPFKQARKIACSLKFKSIGAYDEAYQSGKLPPGLPASPKDSYSEDPEWRGNPGFLGYEGVVRLLPFKQARKIARSLKFKNYRPYREAYLAEQLPLGLPASPSTAYGKDPDWKGLPDFLGNNGITFLPFKEARKVAQSLKFKSRTAYRKAHESEQLPPGLPRDPRLVYGKDPEWKGLPNFLGNKGSRVPILPFKQARKVARALKFKTLATYREAYQSEQLPPGLPRDPGGVYGKDPDWKGGPDFLGYYRVPRLPVKQARRVTRHQFRSRPKK